MIIRLGNTLAKKIKETVLPPVPPSSSPFADWTARLFTADRTQYILVSNTSALYSAVFYGKGVTDANQLINRVLDSLRDIMTEDGFESIYEKRIGPETGEFLLSKTANRSVTGSMNDMIWRGKYHLIRDEISPFDVSSLLNKTPMSSLKYGYPRDAFGLMAEEPEGPAQGNNVILFPKTPGRPQGR
ncbi:MAG TPA: hypothetical protein VGJ94_03020 [Syntrophorhabdaceae bacterium]